MPILIGNPALSDDDFTGSGSLDEPVRLASPSLLRIIAAVNVNADATIRGPSLNVANVTDDGAGLYTVFLDEPGTGTILPQGTLTCLDSYPGGVTGISLLVQDNQNGTYSIFCSTAPDVGLYTPFTLFIWEMP